MKSIFSTNPLNIEYNKEELKKEILEYLESNKSVTETFYNSKNQKYWISISDVMKKFVFDNLPFKYDEIKKLSLEQLIELFINIEKNYKKIADEIYSKKDKDNINKKYLIEEYEFNNNLSNKIKDYIRENNIILKSNEYGSEIIDFSNSIFLYNVDDSAALNALNKYLRIRDSFDINSFYEKEQILSCLKNKFDFLFKENKINSNRYIDIKSQKLNEYIEIHSNKIKTNWQTLGSHSSSAKNENHKEIIKKYEQLEIVEKHKVLNELIDSIIIWHFLYK